MSLHRLVLVLNASYEPINIVPARRAMTLIMKGAAVVQERSNYFIRTPEATFPLPSVVRLVTYRRMPRHNRSVSRKGIILRDSSTCQYCRRQLPSADLTMDHVIPRSRGGGSTWENLVACCFGCNNRKGNRTPGEAGMELARAPRQISIHVKHRLMASDQEVWSRYMFA